MRSWQDDNFAGLLRSCLRFLLVVRWVALASESATNGTLPYANLAASVLEIRPFTSFLGEFDHQQVVDVTPVSNVLNTIIGSNALPHFEDKAGASWVVTCKASQDGTDDDKVRWLLDYWVANQQPAFNGTIPSRLRDYVTCYERSNGMDAEREPGSGLGFAPPPVLVYTSSPYHNVSFPPTANGGINVSVLNAEGESIQFASLPLIDEESRLYTSHESGGIMLGPEYTYDVWKRDSYGYSATGGFELLRGPPEATAQSNGSRAGIDAINASIATISAGGADQLPIHCFDSPQLCTYIVRTQVLGGYTFYMDVGTMEAGYLERGDAFTGIRLRTWRSSSLFEPPGPPLSIRVGLIYASHKTSVVRVSQIVGFSEVVTTVNLIETPMIDAFGKSCGICYRYKAELLTDQGECGPCVKAVYVIEWSPLIRESSGDGSCLLDANLSSSAESVWCVPAMTTFFFRAEPIGNSTNGRFFHNLLLFVFVIALVASVLCCCDVFILGVDKSRKARLKAQLLGKAGRFWWCKMLCLDRKGGKDLSAVFPCACFCFTRLGTRARNVGAICCTSTGRAISCAAAWSACCKGMLTCVVQSFGSAPPGPVPGLVLVAVAIWIPLFFTLPNQIGALLDAYEDLLKFFTLNTQDDEVFPTANDDLDLLLRTLCTCGLMLALSAWHISWTAREVALQRPLPATIYVWLRPRDHKIHPLQPKLRCNCLRPPREAVEVEPGKTGKPNHGWWSLRRACGCLDSGCEGSLSVFQSFLHYIVFLPFWIILLLVVMLLTAGVGLAIAGIPLRELADVIEPTYNLTALLQVYSKLNCSNYPLSSPEDIQVTPGEFLYVCDEISYSQSTESVSGLDHFLVWLAGELLVYTLAPDARNEVEVDFIRSEINNLQTSFISALAAADLAGSAKACRELLSEGLFRIDLVRYCLLSAQYPLEDTTREAFESGLLLLWSGRGQLASLLYRCADESDNLVVPSCLGLISMVLLLNAWIRSYAFMKGKIDKSEGYESIGVGTEATEGATTDEAPSAGDVGAVYDGQGEEGVKGDSNEPAAEDESGQLPAEAQEAEARSKGQEAKVYAEVGMDTQADAYVEVQAEQMDGKETAVKSGEENVRQKSFAHI